MARPRKDPEQKRKRVQLDFSEDTYKKVQEAATARGCSVTYYIKELMRTFDVLKELTGDDNGITVRTKNGKEIHIIY
ncbi:MAG: hypothetical protein ABL899_00685 [Nitrospira sp.]